MATMIILNLVISAMGVGLVPAVMRFGYLVGGGAIGRSAGVAELPSRSQELERAA